MGYVSPHPLYDVNIGSSFEQISMKVLFSQIKHGVIINLPKQRALRVFPRPFPLQNIPYRNYLVNKVDLGVTWQLPM